MKIATYIGFLYLAWLTPNALADKVFELEEIRSGNDISNVRKIYPEAKVGLTGKQSHQEADEAFL